VKRCRRCGETQPVEQFNRDARSPDGRHPRCRRCRADIRASDPAKGCAIVTAQERAQRLWGMLSPEGRTRVAAELERHGTVDVDMLAELGGLDPAA
jgi:hypothetical protein